VRWLTGWVHWTPGYRELAPPSWLRDTLSCLWVRVVPPGGASSTLVLPDAATDLIWYNDGTALLAGPDTGPAPSSAASGAVLVGARFLPGAGGPVLGLALSEVLNQRIGADDVPALRGRIPSAATPPERVLAELPRLIADLAQQRPADRAITHAARLLGRSATTAGEVAAELELSERQFRRRCEASVGYGPRTLQRILRFRRFVSAVDAGPLPDGLAGAAADAGYADQPHLTRECTRLSGLTPRALAIARTSVPASALPIVR
jgi:AraC-like DNA-binding protein